MFVFYIFSTRLERTRWSVYTSANQWRKVSHITGRSDAEEALYVIIPLPVALKTVNTGITAIRHTTAYRRADLYQSFGGTHCSHFLCRTYNQQIFSKRRYMSTNHTESCLRRSHLLQGKRNSFICDIPEADSEVLIYLQVDDRLAVGWTVRGSNSL